ncbi:RNA helicase [Malassezia yamatoensis]|uniref:ATP-dependent RNA helicase n=1 Tax=Malassezia yamatoensis TaxID=253288 RepID=A0AAJ6CFM9_9BASI|nr:RNA helicase [Malassezia yamatoensis]
MWWRAESVRRGLLSPASVRSASRWVSTSARVLSSEARTTTIEALKGSIKGETYRALTVKPFQFTNLTEVQSRVLALLPDLGQAGLVDTALPMSDNEGRDLLVKARTGTGKTVAFLVPTIESRRAALDAAKKGEWTDSFKNYVRNTGKEHLLNETSPSAQKQLQELFQRQSVGVLILSPTRELATQIANEANKLLLHQRSLNVHLLVGGNDKRSQRDDWRRHSRDIVVATPGRLMDLMEDEMFRGPLTTTQALVLDEADMLLEMGFREDIQQIIRDLPSPEKRSTMLFSATINSNIEAIARATLHENHRFIDCVPAGEDSVHKHIPQFATSISDPRGLYPHLLNVIARDQLANNGKSKVMVFLSTTKQTRLAARILRDVRSVMPFEEATRVFEIHSDMPQMRRNKIAQSYRNCTDVPSILVTSDVSARGVDYPGVTEVVQVGVPSSPEIYVHRVGRTGRGNKDGRADLVLMDWEDAFVAWELKDIPLQRLSADDLANEVQDLALKVDADPTPPPRINRRAGREARAESLLKHRPITQRVDKEKITSALEHTYSMLEEETCYSVFTSLCGFYTARAQTLRLHKGDLIDHLSNLVKATSGLTERPKLSENMKRNLGVYDNTRGSRQGSQRSSHRFSPRQSSHSRRDWQNNQQSRRRAY